MRTKAKRIYAKLEADDGVRILVDRLGPRGLHKDEARIDLWLNDIAPSDGLRKWFAHEPFKWPEFKKSYFAELKNKKFVRANSRSCQTRRRHFAF